MKRFILALFLLLLLPVTAYARVLDIQELTTPLGIKVWLVPDNSLPVLALGFAFRDGAAGAPAAKQGVTQLLSNTLDEGAGDIKSKEFQAALRDNAIDLAFSSDRDNFSGALRTLDTHKEQALKLLKAALLSPRFDAEAVDRMRAANISRIKSSMGESDWIASRLLYDAIYKGHPYARNTGGSLATMARLNAADLRAERKRLFARDRLVVGITGDLTKEAAAKLVDDVFGTLPAKVDAKPLVQSEMPAAGKPVFYLKDMPQTTLSMAWPGIGPQDADYYAMQVMNYIFGGGSFSSRLMTEIREKRGLTYGIYSSPLNLDYAYRLTVSGSMLPKNVKPTIDMVNAIAKSMKDTDVTADDLRGAKDYLIGSMPLGLSSSSRIAGTLVSLQLNDRPITSLDDYRAKIEAVTPADIRRVAARVFGSAPIVVLVGAKPDGVDVNTVTTIPDAEGSPEK